MATDQNDRLLGEILAVLGEVADLLRGSTADEEDLGEAPAAPAPKRATKKQAPKAAS